MSKKEVMQPLNESCASESIIGLFALVGLAVLFIIVVSNKVFMIIVGAAIVFLTFGVIPFPRGAKAKLAEKKKLAQRIEDLQSLYPREMHKDWPHTQTEWSRTRRWVIEERAQRELKTERRKEADFPWNLPWWGRLLCCVPWLVDGLFFFGDRVGGWPLWR